MKSLKRVAVTGASGQIGYSLLFRIASGEMFGEDQPVALHLLEIEQAVGALQGVVMELRDCAYPLLQEVVTGSDPEKVFDGVNLAILVGAMPRSKGMERKDLLEANGSIFVRQGKALNKVAAKDVEVFVVGNPCNTNCLIAMHSAPDIPRERFSAMTRLDHNRARFQLAQKAGVEITEVDRITIWGNHSATQVPDFVNATIGSKSAESVIGDRKWLEGEFATTVQKRGAAIIEARGKSSAASAANAIIDGVRANHFPLKDQAWFSSAIVSDKNPYGIAEGLIFSFPCQLKGNKVEIVPNLPWDSFIEEKIRLTEQELVEEKEAVAHLLK